MPLTPFYKYHGAGNDFVLFDNRKLELRLSTEVIARLCDRHFGIGSDGLMLLEEPRHAGDDFYMVYFNSDGGESTMCGNGGRCIAKFARDLGIVTDRAQFSAIDGPHWATFSDDKVQLGMADVAGIYSKYGGFFVDTGSPHHVELKSPERTFVEDAREKRNLYGPAGSNVNFVEVVDGVLALRTFERGVEDETLACGTGCVAAAIVAVDQGWIDRSPIKLSARGGDLEVSFSGNGPYTDVVLTGPAVRVFEGFIELD